MAGGPGDDVYLVDSAFDTVIELPGEGVDLVVAALVLTLPTQVENLTLASPAEGGFGNTLLNVLRSHFGGACLFVLAGNDSLLGKIGADMLDGGTGNDSMEGGLGDDVCSVDSSADVIVELPGGGTGRVIASANYSLSHHIENLTLAAGVVAGTGNDQDNTLTGNDVANNLAGAGGNDSLVGGLGNDTLNGGDGNDTLVGGTGIDRLVGGTGNE